MTQNYFDDTTPMSELVEGFHVLGPRTPGARPWNPDAFDTWAEETYSVLSSGEKLAVSFVRDVWTMGKSDVVPRFNLADALMGWDDRNWTHALSWLDAHVGATARERLERRRVRDLQRAKKDGERAA